MCVGLTSGGGLVSWEFRSSQGEKEHRSFCERLSKWNLALLELGAVEDHHQISARCGS